MKVKKHLDVRLNVSCFANLTDIHKVSEAVPSMEVKYQKLPRKWFQSKYFVSTVIILEENWKVISSRWLPLSNSASTIVK